MKKRKGLTFRQAESLLWSSSPLPEDFPWEKCLSPSWSLAHIAAKSKQSRIPKNFSYWNLQTDLGESVFLYYVLYRDFNNRNTIQSTFSGPEFRCKNLLDIQKECVLT